MTQPAAEPTRLDIAHAAMTTAPQDDALRLRFYERLADGELFLLLDEEPTDDDLAPRVFELEDGPVVLVFDSEDRLAEFAGEVAPYAALPGRVIAQTLAGQGVGLGLNLGVAPSALVLPPDALDWLAETLQSGPQETVGRPVSFDAPKGLPESLMTALDAKLARAGGLASAALLGAVTYDDGRRGHLLVFLDATPGAEGALARAAAEALTFSGIDAGEMDVVFLDSADASAQAMARVGLRFDLPESTRAEPATPTAPGSDPNRPPILR